MDPVFGLLLILLGFMIIGALVATETEDLLSAVICIGAVGFALAVTDLLLAAPDLAITQVVVEIICLVILIRVVLTRRDETQELHKDTFAIGSVMLLLGGVAILACLAFQSLQPFGEPLLAGPQAGVSADYLRRGLEDTGAANYVMGVLLDYRAYDTLGEATVIFTSIIGAYVVLRKIGRIRHAAAGHESDR